MTTPRYVQAWAKVHGATILTWDGRWAQFDKSIRDSEDGLERPPQADSDAWLAGMVRAIHTSEHGLMLIPPVKGRKEGPDLYAVNIVASEDEDQMGYGSTLEDAIINAVLGTEE